MKRVKYKEVSICYLAPDACFSCSKDPAVNVRWKTITSFRGKSWIAKHCTTSRPCLENQEWLEIGNTKLHFFWVRSFCDMRHIRKSMFKRLPNQSNRFLNLKDNLQEPDLPVVSSGRILRQTLQILHQNLNCKWLDLLAKNSRDQFGKPYHCHVWRRVIRRSSAV